MGGIDKNLSSNVSLPRKSLLENLEEAAKATKDMYDEYRLMRSHDYQYLDDYYHCKANYKAARRGEIGEKTAEFLGNKKEKIDYYKNRFYKGLSKQEAYDDYKHDLSINKIGRERAKENRQLTAQEACADFRERNKSLPKIYW